MTEKGRMSQRQPIGKIICPTPCKYKGNLPICRACQKIPKNKKVVDHEEVMPIGVRGVKVFEPFNKAVDAAIALRSIPLQKAKGRKRHVPGEMNQTEAKYASHLELRRHAGDVLWWIFESVTLKLGPDCRYTTDFFVMMNDGTLEIHEVKARKKITRPDGSSYFTALIEDDAKAKLSVCSGMFPFPVSIVFENPDGTWNSVSI